MSAPERALEEACVPRQRAGERAALVAEQRGREINARFFTDRGGA